MKREPVQIHKRKSFTQKDRARIFAAHGGICYLSGVKIGATDEWQIEHVLALALGGTNDDENLRPALTDPHKAKTRNDVRANARCNRLIKKSDPMTRKPSRMKSAPFQKPTTKQKWPSRPFEKRKP